MTYNHTPSTPHYNTAPASGDAKFCVSRAMTAYYRRHIITHTHCADLLGRRKILRLYFSYRTNSNQHSSPYHHIAPASRDAKSCVSRAMTAYYRRHIIIHTHCADLLGRRKILRLYFCRQQFNAQ